ncbi:MAG: tRNA uridine-5-carboxymethylaminomethyl(34) synthesis GTPase MnmE [Spirochaetia bacterium]|jgi:tRNA modification GTPase|nr:tRNA uridine-5-carboxymethylaminomethyl(34) synthesis GTPase MnmE [Spirochaetia bacterium]
MKPSLPDYNTEDCIAALASPWGQSALAIIRASGKGSLERLAPAFSNARLLRAPGNTLLHGKLTDPAGGEIIDEVLTGVFRPGASYTGEEAFELYCHGSLAVIRRVLALLRSRGFRDAQPGEFTFRAFLNGRLDLTQAEAVGEIATSQTDKARSLALRRLSGAVTREVNTAKAFLAEALAAVEIRLDYPEEETPEEDPAAEDPRAPESLKDSSARAREILERLLATYREGRLYREGSRVALAGRINAGKSSLFNYLLKEERSIVSGHPGTTRDYIEGLISLEGIPVRLYDTAGLRDSGDPVEHEGVRRSRLLLESADLVLYLVDASGAITDEDKKNIAALAGRVLVAGNKIDLAKTCPPGVLAVSARTGEGVPALLEEMRKRLAPAGLVSAEQEAVIQSERQRDSLEKSLAALRRFISRADSHPLDILAEDLREALSALGEITGEVATEQMLRLMFSRFCVGK